ncbi:NTPase [Methanococcoides methylutens]|uniref:Nucleoside-triphosphatase LI82_00650 n=1 Tax=Methanococcoides methylutens TaxID=2226 RepID=A0A099T3H9_METMT|nr:NTPase [Methanococcoides methylutens]KGK99755.1 NTPase [Methanococcoides methylutens]
MLRIAITGKPGVGKSTVVSKIVEKLDLKACGIRAAEIRVEGQRQGFSIEDIDTGRKGILSHVECTGPKMGKYHVNLEDLNDIGAKAIRDAIGCDLVVIDEVGPMELKSDNFIRAVEKVLDSERPILAVLHRSSKHPLAQRIREEFEVLTVDEVNRDDLPDIITTRFQ